MPVQMTPSQFASITKPKPRRAAQPSRARKVNPELRLTEADVVSQITGYLRSMGWTCVRQQSGVFTRPGAAQRAGNCITIGEVGAADWYAYRPHLKRAQDVEFMFMEFKAPGKMPSAFQLSWLADKWKRGISADWFDGLEAGRAFIPWYRLRFGRYAGDPAGFGLAPSAAGSQA